MANNYEKYSEIDRDHVTEVSGWGRGGGALKQMDTYSINYISNVVSPHFHIIQQSPIASTPW